MSVTESEGLKKLIEYLNQTKRQAETAIDVLNGRIRCSIFHDTLKSIDFNATVYINKVTLYDIVEIYLLNVISIKMKPFIINDVVNNYNKKIQRNGV
jgi:hypothetical protein